MKLELWCPVRPKFINQPFGVNPQTYAQFGLNGHNGIDFGATHAEEVRAAHDGIAYYEVDANQGHGVVLRTNEPREFADGTQAYAKTIYWHLCDPIKEPQYASPVWKQTKGDPNVGVPVRVGDLIGYADNTGFSTGDHLHFGLKPQAQNESNGTWMNTEQTNGYLGAIDPTPYFNGQFADDAQKQVAIVSLAQKVVALLKQLKQLLGK